MHGYSKTPLARKLGIKEGYSIYLVNEPKHYMTLFSDFPDNSISLLKNPEPDSVDFIHLFCTRHEDFEHQIHRCKPLLKKAGMIWVSWPKGSSKIETDINRDIIRTYILRHVGLVDIKVAAVDADWSGLKFVYRVKDR